MQRRQHTHVIIAGVTDEGTPATVETFDGHAIKFETWPTVEMARIAGDSMAKTYGATLFVDLFTPNKAYRPIERRSVNISY